PSGDPRVLRSFPTRRSSDLVTALGLVAGALYGGWAALGVVAILGVLEVSLSFDNAVINAGVLKKMNAFWQRIFLTIGILIAVFGDRKSTRLNSSHVKISYAV